MSQEFDCDFNLRTGSLSLARRTKDQIETDDKKVARLYAEGLSEPKIAHIVKTSQPTVSRALARQHVETRRRGPQEIDLPLEELRENDAYGMTLDEQAKIYNVSDNTIRNRLRRQ